MIQIIPVDGGFKVEWRRRLPGGGYRKRSRWVRSDDDARLLVGLLEANNGMLPSPKTLREHGLLEHAEPIDPKLVCHIRDALEAHATDEEQVAAVRVILAQFEMLFDNEDGALGVLG